MSAPVTLRTYLGGGIQSAMEDPSARLLSLRDAYLGYQPGARNRGIADAQAVDEAGRTLAAGGQGDPGAEATASIPNSPTPGPETSFPTAPPASVTLGGVFRNAFSQPGIFNTDSRLANFALTNRGRA